MRPCNDMSAQKMWKVQHRVAVTRRIGRAERGKTATTTRTADVLSLPPISPARARDQALTPARCQQHRSQGYRLPGPSWVLTSTQCKHQKGRGGSQVVDEQPQGPARCWAIWLWVGRCLHLPQWREDRGGQRRTEEVRGDLELWTSWPARRLKSGGENGEWPCSRGHMWAVGSTSISFLCNIFLHW